MRQCPPFDHQASPSVARSNLSWYGTAAATSGAPRNAAWRNGSWTTRITSATGTAIRGANQGWRRSDLLAVRGGEGASALASGTGLVLAPAARSALTIPPSD